ncbi:MAG: hypothetical protein NT075_03280 [Chloroflexi bacterium]|nr:hypothetical protein [Chloroflexota bacterium]
MRIKHLLVHGAGWIAHVITLLIIGILVMPWDDMPQVFAQNQSGITSPTSGATITSAVPIIGTAVNDQFQKYELAFKLEPSGDDAYVYFAGGTSQVINGQLGTWQAGGLAPGVYSLRLRVVKNDGNYNEFPVQNLSVNQQPAGPTATTTITGTATPSTPTETPIPTATFTPAPQPTVAVGQVTQPQVDDSGDQSTPVATVASAEVTVDIGQSTTVITGTAIALGASVNDNTSAQAPSSSSNLSRQIGEQLSLDRLRTRFYTGVRLSAALFFAAFALFAGKRIFAWAWTRYR